MWFLIVVFVVTLLPMLNLYLKLFSHRISDISFHFIKLFIISLLILRWSFEMRIVAAKCGIQ